jgi:hypothetical protein
MITSLTKQQLAFILDIKAEEARAKMCVAYCKFKGIENEAEINSKGKVTDPYPQAIDIDILSVHLNLPTLKAMVEDIEKNFLIRPASKKWILCDYPEKKLKALKEAGDKRLRVTIPSGLKSMLSDKTQQIIKNQWLQRYKSEGILV